MKQITTFTYKYQADEVLQAMVGELGARYDPFSERYSYARDGQQRFLWLERNSKDRWVLCIDSVTAAPVAKEAQL